ncbi:hypothetical protein STEG23_020289 [Scotinomys teguina]
MVNSFLCPIQRMLKQRDLKVSDSTIKGFLEDIDQAAPWFGASGDVNLPCWEKLGRDLTESKGRGELRAIGLSQHIEIACQNQIVRKEGNLKEERPKSSKASSKLHTKVEKEKETDQGKKEKETDQGKIKQKPSGLYPVLDEFSDITLSDSAEDELDSEEEEDLEEAAAAYERERYSSENTEPPPYYPPKAKLKGISSAPVASNAHFIKPRVWGQLATAFPVFEDPTMHNRFHEACSKEVATAIRGAIILAKLSIVPVWRGYWGNKTGKPHTVPCKVTGRCGSALVRLIPAPRGIGIVSAPVPKKLLMMAGTDDCYTSARGCTATLGNFAKATFDAISKTYSYLTPDLWKETVFTTSPYQEFTDHLVKTHTRVSVQRTQAPTVAS